MELSAGKGRNNSFGEGSAYGFQQILGSRSQGSGHHYGKGSWSVFGLVVVLLTGSQTGPPIATADV